MCIATAKNKLGKGYCKCYINLGRETECYNVLNVQKINKMCGDPWQKMKLSRYFSFYVLGFTVMITIYSHIEHDSKF